MAGPPDYDSQERTGRQRRHRRPLAWSRLLRSNSPEEVLEELGRWLGPPVVDLRLTSTGSPVTEIGYWRGSSGVDAACRRPAVVRGEPDWRLVIGLSEDAGAVGEQAVTLLEVWRQTREELERIDRGLSARSGELDMLQVLGRSAAEARTPRQLFRSTISVLQRGEELDLALVAYLMDGSPEHETFSMRPFSSDYLRALEQRAARFLGWSPDSIPRREPQQLDGFDGARGVHAEFREEDLILLPLMRRSQPVGCLLVVPAGPTGERRLRLLYSAGNQLSLHLDRILTVREAEAGRFRSIIDSMPQGVLLADRRLRVLHCNRAGLKMLGWLGLSGHQDLSETFARTGIEELVERVREGRSRLAEGETRVVGDRIWGVTVSPLLDDGGDVDGVVLVLTDITESRKLQQHLLHAEKMSSLGQMISGVAHELNNPLATILGYTQLIRPSSDAQQLESRLEILRKEAGRCKKIVQNLLSFARRHDPERKPLSLNQSVRSVVSLLAYQLRVDDIEVETVCDQDLPAMQGDVHEIEQVLVNLITNAQQAIRQSGRPGTIRIQTRRRGDGALVLEIGDSGCGIPPAIRSRVFDPFFTTKPSGEGTGLGLSLVYGIVTGHGGTIQVDPGDDPGATFVLVFPVADVASRQTESACPASDPLLSSTTGRILVVDDEEPVARLICEALEGDGHSTEWAGDGRAALERLAQGVFDLIISDIKMPGMNAEKLTEELKGGMPDLSRRLLLTTGDTLGAVSDGLVARTGLEVLRKPFDLDDLRRKVRAMLDTEEP